MNCASAAGHQKRRFGAYAAAAYAAAVAYDKGGTGVAPYLCPDCGWWHIGKPPRRAK